MYPYFSSLLIANRSAAVDSFAEISAILLRASERYIALAARSGQLVINSASAEQASDASIKSFGIVASPALLEEACAITCDTHSALIAAAETQVRRLDQLVRGMLQHAADWAPWEGAVAFDALRTSLNSAEHTIHEMTEVATHTLEIAEKEARLVATAVAAPPRQRKRA